MECTHILEHPLPCHLFPALFLIHRQTPNPLLPGHRLSPLWAPQWETLHCHCPNSAGLWGLCVYSGLGFWGGPSAWFVVFSHTTRHTSSSNHKQRLLPYCFRFPWRLHFDRCTTIGLVWSKIYSHYGLPKLQINGFYFIAVKVEELHLSKLDKSLET